MWAVRMRIIDFCLGVPVLWKNDLDGDGIDDPGDDFPNDGAGENEVLLNGHNPNLDP
jgi:hypothetical protein